MAHATRKDMANIIAGHTLKQGINKSYAREVASLLLTERRTGELDSLLRDIQAEWAENGYVEALAKSAHPLTTSVKDDIISRVKQLYPAAKKVIVTVIHDPEIVGGVRVSLPNQQLDLSIQAKLNKFKQLTTAGGDQ